ncbi:MAG: ABC transporter transmembrane domain-containing protein [Sulfurovum sp.]|nr:ABC transporter transmembrane domain-containing protein [Sulfurovum sp.]
MGKSHGLIETISTYVFSSDIKGYVLFILIIIIFLRIASTLLSILQSKIFVSISKNITYSMRISLLEHLKSVSLKEYESMRVGAVTSKLITDVETIDAFVSSTISKLIVAILLLLFSAIILLWIHWQLAIFILLTNPLVILFTVRLARNVGRLKKEENKAIEFSNLHLLKLWSFFIKLERPIKKTTSLNKIA